MYAAAPGAKVTFTADTPVTGWRAVTEGDAGWGSLDADAGKAVMVAPLPSTSQVPQMIFAAAAEAASPSDRAVRLLPNTIAADGNLTKGTCTALGDFSSEDECRAEALARDGLWAYTWYDPAQLNAGES